MLLSFKHLYLSIGEIWNLSRFLPINDLVGDDLLCKLLALFCISAES